MNLIAIFFGLMYLWSKYPDIKDSEVSTSKPMSIATKTFKTLINLQLACFAFFQIPSCLAYVQESPNLKAFLQTSGLLFNYEASYLNVSI